VSRHIVHLACTCGRLTVELQVGGRGQYAGIVERLKEKVTHGGE